MTGGSSAPTRAFFCGATNDLTEEDVFPAWLHREQNMANESLTLLNGTTIRYSQMLVPACRSARQPTRAVRQG
jgi:hypothetical protein